jgi:hypothetical protein
MELGDAKRLWRHRLKALEEPSAAAALHPQRHGSA